MSAEIGANIEGIIQSLDIEDFMYPLYELLVNSFQAIEERVSADKGAIEITIERESSGNGILFDTIKSVSFTDNGIGFNEDNFKSFRKAYSRKKVEKGGKGIGRFAALAVFNNIHVESVYAQGSQKHERVFTLSRITEKIEIEQERQIDDGAELKTTITISDINDTFKEKSALKNTEEIARDLLNHCLLYYLNGAYPNVTVNEGSSSYDLSELYDDNNLPIENYEEEIKGKKFYAYAIRNIDRRIHTCYLCAHNRVVKTKRATTILPLFDSPIKRNEEIFNISLYIVSDFLDSAVNQSRTDFKFPKKEGTTDELNLSLPCIQESDIHDFLYNALSSMFQDELKIWQGKQLKRVEEVVHSDEGVGYRNMPLDAKTLNSMRGNATAKEIKQTLARRKFERSEEFTALKDKLFERDYSNLEDYQTLMSDVLQRLNQENVSQLAEYVTHRKVVIHLMESFLQWKNENKEYEEEKMLHNLIYTMGGTQSTIPYDRHNLWLLDDRLAFYQFIKSDKAIRTHTPIKGCTECPKETDLCLYNVPFIYGDKDYEDVIKTVVIFELKRPGITVSMMDYLKQADEQIAGVSKGVIVSSTGKNCRIPDNTPIYFYFVCDETTYNNMKQGLCSRFSYRVSPYDTLMFTSENIHYEVTTYQQLLVNAKRRNRIFFDKLGL